MLCANTYTASNSCKNCARRIESILTIDGLFIWNGWGINRILFNFLYLINSECPLWVMAILKTISGYSPYFYLSNTVRIESYLEKNEKKDVFYSFTMAVDLILIIFSIN